MKGIKKIASIFLVTFLLVCCTAVPAFAATVNQDNLEIQLITDKQNYAEGEEISAELTVTNKGEEEVKDIKIKTLVPDNYKLSDESVAEKNISSLKPGETVSVSGAFVSTTVVTKPSSAQPTTQQATTVQPTTASQPNTTVQPTTVKQPTTDAKSNTQPATGATQNNAAVQTGLQTGVLAVILFIVIAAAIVFAVFKYRKHSVKLMSIFLCVAVAFSALPITYFAAEDDSSDYVEKSVQVKEIVKVADNDVTIESDISYKIGNKYNVHYVDDELTYTRGEWVKLLNEKFEIENIEISEGYDYFYGDSIDSPYGVLAETAHSNGILPPPDSEGYEDPEQDIPLFEAEKPATREYVAYTVSKAMGFEGEYTFEPEDLEDIKYVSEAAVMVNQSFMLLQNNRFNPASPVTGADVNKIINRINYFNDGLVVDEDNPKDEVVLQDDVLNLTDNSYKVTENEDGTYSAVIKKSDEASKIKTGSVFVLPENDEYIGGISLEASEITSDEENYYVSCVKPEIEDVVESFDFEGKGEADVENIETAENVEVEYDPNGVVSDNPDDDPAAFDLGGSIGAGKITFTLKKKLVGDVSANGSVSVSLPEITAKAKGKIFGGFRIDELMFTIKKKASIEANLEYKADNDYLFSAGKVKIGTGKSEIGRLPVKLGATGFSIDIVFFVNLEVSGKLSISYSIEEVSGVQYKDGAFRTIKEQSSNIDGIELNGTAKVGPGIAARLTLMSVFDLVGIDAHMGIGATVKFDMHPDCDPILYCGDGTIYFYLTMELDDDTLIIDILQKVLHTSWSWDIFDEGNSPLKLNIHFENMKRVDHCTYGSGSLLGIVKDARTGEKIPGARVKLYNNSTNQLVMSGFTKTEPVSSQDGNTVYAGEFLVQNLPVGTYRIEVAATGYAAATVNVDVVNNQCVVGEATLMIKRNDMDGVGTVTGTITDALTGSSVNDVTYNVRKGLNISEGDVIATGTASGSYSLDLEPGYYSLEFSKDGYIKEIKSVTITEGDTVTKNIALAPSSDISIGDDSFRVVLTWGEYPRDLDSHMYLVNNDETIFHTWYVGKDYYRDSEMTANLDLDDTDSYGPETSTVYNVDDDGTYSFYVHDYTNRYSSNSKAMSNSGAQVKLFSGDSLVATFNIPENREGTLWHVFDYDAATDEFKYVNEFSYAEKG